MHKLLATSNITLRPSKKHNCTIKREDLEATKLLFADHYSQLENFRCPKDLTTSELKQLQSLLKKEGANTLAQIIRRLPSQSTRRLAPQPYHELFFELSLNTPVCGIFQITGNEEAIEVVQLVASGVDISQCQYQVGRTETASICSSYLSVYSSKLALRCRNTK